MLWNIYLKKDFVVFVVFSFLVYFFAFFIPLNLMGSMPVEKTLDGCVVGGRFFSVYKDPQTNLPSKAYLIRIEKNIDLSLFEGKTLSIEGTLLPGDRFFVKENDMPKVVSDTCDKDYLKVIRKELIMEYRVAGYIEAKKNNFEEALRLVNWALDMDKTSCDSYVSRAQIYYIKGDFASGWEDIKTVKDGLCIVEPQGLNYLVLEEIGITLEKSGRNADALGLYKLGLTTCQSDMCRETMNKNIRRLNKK